MFQQSVFKEYHSLLKFGLRLADITIIFIAAYLAHFYRFQNFNLNDNYTNTLWLALVATFICFGQFHLYDPIRGRRLVAYLFDLTIALIVTMAIIAAGSFAIKSAVVLSREWFLVWGVVAWAMLLVSRFVTWWLAYLFRKNGWNPRKVVIVGTNELAVNLMKEMRETLGNGFKVVAFVSVDDALTPNAITDVPVRVMPKQFSKWIRRTAAHEVWIALPLKDEEAIKAVLYELRHNLIKVRYVFDFFGLSLHRHAVTEISGFPVIDCFSTPLIGANRLVKVVEDKLLASLILIVISPLLLLIALAIKLTSPGPILFRQKRHGWNGQEIDVYKFRSMYVHQENPGVVAQATKNDDRVTKVGRFLRACSLDELPQFINVLQGRMSIVGPRPHAVEHNEYYKELVASYMQRHRVKPGITGWAQINGWRGETDTVDKMAKRVEHDIYYIENWSLWFDLKIILLTLYKGFFDKNAY